MVGTNEWTAGSSTLANGSITRNATSRARTIASASRRCPWVGGRIASRIRGSSGSSFTNFSKRDALFEVIRHVSDEQSDVHHYRSMIFSENRHPLFGIML